MANRPKVMAEISAGASRESGRSFSNAHFHRSSRKIAITPNEPTRLSFMISSIRSRDRPENSPSAESINPSQCRPPVMKTLSVTSKVLRTVPDSQPPVRTATQANSEPASRPTSGKNFTLRPNSPSS